MAHDILGLSARIPWEFAEQPPCRSVVSAFLSSGLPLASVRLLGLPDALLGAAVLLAPRLWMATLSLLMDWVIVRLTRVHGCRGDALPALLVAGTAWPYLLLQTRPYSNSAEALLLTLVLIVTVSNPKSKWAGDAERSRWR
jgi:phosphatidylinositol glycan class Z